MEKSGRRVILSKEEWREKEGCACRGCCCIRSRSLESTNGDVFFKGSFGVYALDLSSGLGRKGIWRFDIGCFDWVTYYITFVRYFAIMMTITVESEIYF